MQYRLLRPYTGDVLLEEIDYKMLSYRRNTAQRGELVLANSAR